MGRRIHGRFQATDDLVLDGYHIVGWNFLADLPTGGAVAGNVLTFDGTSWGPAELDIPEGGGGEDNLVDSVFGRQGDVIGTASDYAVIDEFQVRSLWLEPTALTGDAGYIRFGASEVVQSISYNIDDDQLNVTAPNMKLNSHDDVDTDCYLIFGPTQPPVVNPPYLLYRYSNDTFHFNRKIRLGDVPAEDPPDYQDTPIVCYGDVVMADGQDLLGEDVYVNHLGSSEDAVVYFGSVSDPQEGIFRYNQDADYFIANKGILAQWHDAIDELATFGRADGAHVRFGDPVADPPETIARLDWNKTLQRFEFDHPLYVNGTIYAQLEQFDAMNEPTGFPSRDDNTYSFTDGTRTYSISPTGADFDVWVNGVKYTFSSQQDVVIPDTEGLHFIYVNSSGNFVSTTTFASTLITENALACIVYWDATNNEAIYVGDERHGMTMDGATHVHIHLTDGTKIESGLGLGDITADGNGDLEAAATMSTAGGTIWDEDLDFDITGSSSPAQIPVFYLEGATPVWRRDTARNYPVKQGTSRLAYNEDVGGTWQQTDVDNNDLVLAHIFATNDPDQPYIAIQGQDEYNNPGQARAGALTEIQNLFTVGLPFVEFVAVATVIYQTSNGYANGCKARIRSTDDGDDYLDWRSTTLSSSSGPSSHLNLTNIGVNTHDEIDDRLAETVLLLSSETRTPYVTTADTNAARGTALANAVAAAVSGDYIIVYPGEYDTHDIMVDGVTMYFMPGAKINYTGSTSGAIFDDGGSATVLTVDGFGEFFTDGTGANDQVINLTNGGSSLFIRCKSMESDNGPAVRATGTGSGKITIYADEILSYDGTIDNVSTGMTIEVFARRLSSSNNLVIELDGGSIIVHGAELDGDGTSTAVVEFITGDLIRLENCTLIADTGNECITSAASADDLICINCEFDTDQTNAIVGGNASLNNCWLKDSGSPVTSSGTLKHLDARISKISASSTTVTVEDHETLFMIGSNGITVAASDPIGFGPTFTVSFNSSAFVTFGGVTATFFVITSSIIEGTTGAGVTIDGMLLKDGKTAGANVQVSAPSTASDTGVAGSMAYDSSYWYVCTATNTWKRAALSTW